MLPSAGAHSGAVTEGCEDVRVYAVPGPAPQPALGLVGVGGGEEGGVAEVDAGVEVEVGPGRHLVPGQHQVLLAVAGHLRAVRPQSAHLLC